MDAEAPYRRAGSPSGPPCPRCRSALRDEPLGPTAALRCAACAGLWLGPDALAALAVEPDLQARILARPRPMLDARRAPTYVPCPRCGEIMRRRNLGPRSGIVIDLCASHGCWFDAGELEAAAAYFDDRARSGRPERAPAKAPDASGSRASLAASDDEGRGGSFAATLLEAVCEIFGIVR